MQVDMSQLSPLMAYAVRQSIAQGYAPSLSEYVPDPSSTPTADTPASGGSAANAGTASSKGAGLLAAKTAQLLMRMYQSLSSNQETPDPEAPPSSLPPTEAKAYLAVGMIDSMASCVDDPATANAVVKSLTAPMLVPIRKCGLKNGQLLDGADDYARNVATLNGINPQLQMIYNRDQSAGKSTAQSIDDMLALQLSQPESYWNARDPDHILGNQKEIVRIQFDALTLALAQSTGDPGLQSAATSAG